MLVIYTVVGIGKTNLLEDNSGSSLPTPEWNAFRFSKDFSNLSRLTIVVPVGLPEYS